MIRKLPEKADPRSLFYFNCEELADYKELLEVLETYLELRDMSEIKSACIFLDEITSPGEWHWALKSMIDQGELSTMPGGEKPWWKILKAPWILDLVKERPQRGFTDEPFDFRIFFILNPLNFIRHRWR